MWWIGIVLTYFIVSVLMGLVTGPILKKISSRYPCPNFYERGE